MMCGLTNKHLSVVHCPALSAGLAVHTAKDTKWVKIFFNDYRSIGYERKW
jgi:hypothetical protein